MANGEANMARDEAQGAYDRASAAKNESEIAHEKLQNLINRIKEFLTRSGARPADIRQVGRNAEAEGYF